MKRCVLLAIVSLMFFCVSCQSVKRWNLVRKVFGPVYKNVVLVTSGSLGDVRTTAIVGGMKERLNTQEYYRITLRSFEMNLAEEPEKVWKEEMSRSAIDHIMAFHPDVAVIHGEDACQLVLDRLLDEDIQFVFLDAGMKVSAAAGTAKNLLLIPEDFMAAAETPPRNLGTLAGRAILQLFEGKQPSEVKPEAVTEAE